MFSPLLERLIHTLRCLPGVGPKSAQRIAFHLLERDRNGAIALAKSLLTAMESVGHCRLCRTFSETELCQLCQSPRRDHRLLCIVENPADMFSVEQGTSYRGLYFVLMGRLSPLDGIGPDELGLDILVKRLRENEITEVILATNPTIEGETTASYLAEMIRTNGIKVTRIAHGVPMGGELEHVDGGTLSRAFLGRLTL